jgi:predicted nucleotidyltransferase
MDNKFRILNYLAKNQGETNTMNELAKRLRIPYATFYRTIQELDELIVLEAIGSAKTVQLNTTQPVLVSHLALASWEERETFLKKHPVFKKIVEELNPNDTVLVFGSYAKETQTERSDIDLLIINETGAKNTSFSKHELLYKKQINPIAVSQEEYKQMLRDTGENVAKQARKNHIILQNPQKFWELTLHANRIQETI